MIFHFKSANLEKYSDQQIQILKSSILFLHKIQYFYDKSLLQYKSNDKKNALFNLKIAKSFLSMYNKNNSLKKVSNIISETEKYITNNKKFNVLAYQEKVYQNITNIKYSYYIKTQKFINSLQKITNQNKKFNILFQIIILLFSAILIFLFFTYETKEKFKTYAFLDSLTGACNRRMFFKNIKQLQKGTNSLIMFDIDFFKRVNDTFGHDNGDFILKETIKLIRTNIREEDKIFRWGGEEFIIFLKNVNKQKALEIAENLRKNIENYNFNSIKITASFGVKEVKNKIDEEDLKKLDNALYLSKTKGRNQVNSLD